MTDGLMSKILRNKITILRKMIRLIFVEALYTAGRIYGQIGNMVNYLVAEYTLENIAGSQLGSYVTKVFGSIVWSIFYGHTRGPYIRSVLYCNTMTHMIYRYITLHNQDHVIFGSSETGGPASQFSLGLIEVREEPFVDQGHRRAQQHACGSIFWVTCAR